MGRNIPDNHRIIIRRQLHDLIKPLVEVDDVSNLILILSRADLLHQVERRPVSVNQQHAPLREHPAVKELEQECPHHSHNGLHQRHRPHNHDRMELLIQQRDLEICNPVHQNQRKKLRIDDIPFFIKAHLEPAVHLVKKQEQDHVHRNHQPVPLPPERKFHDPVIVINPDVPVNRRFQRDNDGRRQKFYHSFILRVISHFHQSLSKIYCPLFSLQSPMAIKFRIIGIVIGRLMLTTACTA